MSVDVKIHYEDGTTTDHKDMDRKNISYFIYEMTKAGKMVNKPVDTFVIKYEYNEDE